MHIWHAFLPQPHADLVTQQLQLLSTQERHQQGKFHLEQDRHRYLITRTLVRTVLSHYAPIAPQDWVFENDNYGRPTITNRHPLAQRLCFNVSHTDGLVVLIVTSDRQAGIDTENTARHAPLDVAERFFAKPEAQAIQRLPLAEQQQRFWEYWTFKESYIKARGMGLYLPLERFSFELADDAKVTIAFAGSDDNPAAWQFCQYRPDPQHLVAVCLERTTIAPPTLSFWRVQPLDLACPLEVRITRG
ncbi:MAG: 4'-phosphopantetheinyl transferase superfamily protein [Pseudomonadaceae bacterium]|nr:4'-phosphopantetheinyl transferase superfamily protein [Pseudomonadaceae bacterium]